MRLVHRVRGMLFTPRQEWETAAAEQPAVAPLLLGYVLPLAALRGLASVAEHALAGNPLFGVAMGAAGMGVMCVVVLLAAATLHLVAQGFAVSRPYARSAQLAALSMTPAFLGAALVMTPVIGEFLAFVGALYACALLYTGAPVMLGIDEKRAGAFALVAVVIIVVALAVLSFLLAGVLSAILA